MRMYETLKTIHLSFAILTITGFMLRGFWMIQGSAWLQHRLVRVLPHIIDTLFLASGISLILVMHLQVMQNSWLLVKIAALVVYILLGTVALKRGPTMNVRLAAFAAAFLTFTYIAGVALNKSALSWFAAF
jgi:uncharacterized membrane protein SirB2